MASVWSASGMVITALSRVLRSRLHVSGTAGLKYAGPTLFVANHFTRFETCLIPYLLYSHTGRVVRSLADGGLFVGGLANFLRRVNVFPNDDPGYKRAIIEDLVSGGHDWVIFPEGAMIKDKRVRRTDGDLWIKSPWREGPHHTGAAVFALQAETRRAALRGHLGGLAEAWARKDLGDRIQPATLPVQVVPVTFTYYPLRPGDNAIHQAVRWLVGELPEQVQEELKVEGNLLLGDCDIDVHFGTPLVLEPQVMTSWRRMRCAEDPCSADKVERVVVDMGRHGLTRKAMTAVYSSLQINPDHLLVCGLRRCGRHSVSRQHLVLTTYLAARAMDRNGRFRLHAQTMRSLEKELTIGPAPKVDDLLHLGAETGILSLSGDTISVDHQALAAQHGFHSQRLRNPLAVIANELRGNPAAVRVVRRYAAEPTERLRQWLAKDLLHDADEGFRKDYEHYYDPELSRDQSVGCPRLRLQPGARHAVVLSHGYLAAPKEMDELGDELHAAGFSVYQLRLPGHGTAPRNVVDITWRHWLASFRRCMTAIGLLHESILVGGFSTGGLLALCAAAETTAPVAGVISINAPTRLMDRRTRLIPLVKKWGAAMTALGGVPEPRWVANDTESPDVNYTRNYLHGVAELMELMEHAKTRYAKVTAPTLLIQGDNDPVVDPRSGAEIHRALGSGDKQLVSVPRSNHVIVRGKGAARIHRQVLAFCQEVTAASDGTGHARSA